MITLTLIPSQIEIISGIPKTVQFSTNIPATVYYTLDGTLPTTLSPIATGPISLPTNENSVTVSAVAYYFDGYSLVPSAVLSHIFFTDQSALDRTRYVFFEGIVYSYPGGLNIPFYFDAAGDPSFFLDIPPDEIDFIQSDTNSIGEFIGLDTAVIPVDPSFTSTYDDDPAPAFADGNDPENFRSDAQFIQIDGRASAPNPPVIDFINGPLMSLRNSRNSWSGVDFIDTYGTNYISGSATKYHYDRDKKVIVFYYFDSNSSRWVKSIQDLPADTTTGKTPPPTFSNPLVFHWFPFGRPQS